MLLTESLLGTSSTAANYIEDVFSTYLFTGNNSTQTITNGIDLSGKGGLVWFKARNAAFNHTLVDTARGNFSLASNATSAQSAQTWTALSNGFISPAFETYNYASWTFRKQAKFFDVVTYTGNATARTISHNLGSAPGCIIVKRTSALDDWYVYHRSLTSAAYSLILNTTGGQTVDTLTWNNTAPTSTSFSVGGVGAATNVNGETYVAYLFAHNAGGFGAAGTDNVISCGSYTTDGSGNGTLQNIGYEPQWVLVKAATGTAEDWVINDSMRGMFANPQASAYALRPNLTGAESLYGLGVNISSTGFTGFGSASRTYIYIAIRRGPMKTPTSGTSVFALQAYSDGVGGAALAGSTQSFVNLRPDLSVFANRAGSTNNFQFADLLRGYQQTTGPGADTLTTPTLKTTNSNAEATSGNAIYVLPANGSNPPEVRFSSDSVGAKLGYIFRRAPGFFDVVCYTGTGVARTVNHNLGVAPELMIVKPRSNSNTEWNVYAAPLGPTKYIYLQGNSAASTGVNRWNNTAPTSSVFTVATDTSVNGSGYTLVAYLFATLAGVSKVGSYTGSGTTMQIDCGFTAGARFVLIKRTDTGSTGDWYVWDSARGIVAGNDSYLLLNSTAAEVTNTDYVDTYSAGFEISSTAPAAINANGGSFIFLAVA